MAEEIVATGGLLPDEVMLKVVTSKLDSLHNKVSNPPHTTTNDYELDLCGIWNGKD